MIWSCLSVMIRLSAVSLFGVIENTTFYCCYFLIVICFCSLKHQGELIRLVTLISWTSKWFYPPLLPAGESTACVQCHLAVRFLCQNYIVIFGLIFLMMWLGQQCLHFIYFEFISLYLYMHKCSWNCFWLPYIKMEEILGPSNIPFSPEYGCILEELWGQLFDRYGRE
jgi:hypothetical protein